MESQKFNSLQLELLNIYSFGPKEEDLVAIKKILGQYFAGKLEKNVYQAINQSNIIEEDLDSWINE